jgi:hypothetical protein
MLSFCQYKLFKLIKLKGTSSMAENKRILWVSQEIIADGYIDFLRNNSFEIGRVIPTNSADLKSCLAEADGYYNLVVFVGNALAAIRDSEVCKSYIGSTPKVFIGVANQAESVKLERAGILGVKQITAPENVLDSVNKSIEGANKQSVFARA